jgi:hypothetical protein
MAGRIVVFFIGFSPALHQAAFTELVATCPPLPWQAACHSKSTDNEKLFGRSSNRRRPLS